jgi:hypothetical protein
MQSFRGGPRQNGQNFVIHPPENAAEKAKSEAVAPIHYAIERKKGNGETEEIKEIDLQPGDTVSLRCMPAQAGVLRVLAYGSNNRPRVLLEAQVVAGQTYIAGPTNKDDVRVTATLSSVDLDARVRPAGIAGRGGGGGGMGGAAGAPQDTFVLTLRPK